jgi:hypothetical protein
VVVRGIATAAVAMALLGVHTGVALAATPGDGGWKASGPEGYVSLAVAGGGRTITATNSLIGPSATSDCSWGGAIADGPIAIGGDGSFTTSTTAAPGRGGGAGRIDVAAQFTSTTTFHVTATLSACILGEPARTLSFDGSLVTPSAPSTTRSCGALQVRGGRSRSVASKRVRAHPRRYGRSTMFSITAKGATCGDLRGALAKVLEARDESLGLGASGFGVTHVRRKRLHGVLVHEVGAEGGGRVIGYTRVGGGLRVDHALYRAGQAIGVFSNLGRRSPGSACTAAFVLARPQQAPVGLTAGHCARTQNLGEAHTVYREIDQGGPRAIGVEIARDPPGVDAMIFRVYERLPTLMQQVERGELPPLTVDGVVPDAEQTPGKAVCFAGRNSGADQCGHIVPNYPAASPGVRCTDIRATRGDSGGPVYESTGELRTRAVGITAEVVTIHHSMCYTPLGAILQAFGATLAPGPEVPNGVVF